jgi:hypothetical protein
MKESLPILEKEPKIKVHFLFTAHGTEEDLRRLKQALDQADVYAPEFTLLSEFESQFQEVSDGTMAPRDVLELLQARLKGGLPFPGAIAEMLNVIYGSHKPIVSIDVSDDFITQDFTERRNRESANMEKMVACFEEGKTQEAISILRSFAKYMADEFMKRREEDIVKNFKEKMNNVRVKFPELARKSELDILVSFGSAHTSLARMFEKELGLSVSREFNAMPYLFLSIHEAIRRYQYGKEVTDDLMLHAILEVMYIGTFLSKVSQDSEAQGVVGRKILTQLTSEQIKNISQLLGKGEKLEDILERYEISIPKTPEEFNNLKKLV